jgi:hypothetical protein
VAAASGATYEAPVVVAVVIAAVVAVLGALAWWSSGRSRGAEYNPLAAGERGEAEAKTMKQYRPTGGNGPGPVL